MPAWGEAGGRVLPLPPLRDVRLHPPTEGYEVPEQRWDAWEREGRWHEATAGRSLVCGVGYAAASARLRATAQ